ncbi:uncharacterized protein KD926_010613 [Aspergillus affinis]|uniref:uncharacterized protein n=1 Tax=Aspergillus affinis TaxID=1070780 RepID=UPI0022FE9090|nr:uncharacterized protein KD926_010613 [Aspergillus affinis]KAI9038568.1 hypothetical protein KD926_010613 [Aspergillus affinis]
MRFFTSSTLALAALATAQADINVTGETAAVGTNDNSMPFAARNCKPTYTYCGWYLKNTLGWAGVGKPNGLYVCTSGTEATLLASCNKCSGPTAHCA